MKIIGNLLLFEYFLLTVCDSKKAFTSWGNQNDHDDHPDQRMEKRSKRSLFECGVHGQKPTSDSLSVEATLPGEWPWVVAVFHLSGKAFTFRCCASLIDNRFAIATAGCIEGYRNYDEVKLKLDNAAIIVGVRDVSRQTYAEDSTRFLTAIYIHEEYNRGQYSHNIALLVLKEPVTYSNLVKPVCLWKGVDGQDDLEKAIQYGTMVGWYTIAWSGTLEAPNQLNLTIKSHTTCRELQPVRAFLIGENTFCTVFEEMKDRKFDSGHLFIEQRGLWMLRGMECAYSHNTIIYTDVAKYRNWISDTAYRWLQTNSLPLAPNTYAAGNNLSWTQQCSMRDEVTSLISGGQYTREGEWPWHVAIYHNEHKNNSLSYSYKCGGSLISASHVLTAAHCFIDTLTNRPIAKRSINIYLGTNTIKYFSTGVQFKMVDRLEIHQEYNPLTQYKDIALLRLSSPADLTAAVRPVCLWPEDEVDLSHVVGKNGSVVGWGSDEYGLLAEELMLAELPVVSELTCIRSNIVYLKYTNNFTFCAGLLKGTSVCTGDSGGGMVFKLRSGAGTEQWFLRGIVSLRSGMNEPCNPSLYVVYTDVAKYLDWIKNAVSLDMSLN